MKLPLLHLTSRFSMEKMGWGVKANAQDFSQRMTSESSQYRQPSPEFQHGLCCIVVILSGFQISSLRRRSHGPVGCFRKGSFTKWVKNGNIYIHQVLQKQTNKTEVYATKTLNGPWSLKTFAFWPSLKPFAVSCSSLWTPWEACWRSPYLCVSVMVSDKSRCPVKVW